MQPVRRDGRTPSVRWGENLGALRTTFSLHGNASDLSRAVEVASPRRRLNATLGSRKFQLDGSSTERLKSGAELPLGHGGTWPRRDFRPTYLPSRQSLKNETFQVF